MEIEMICVIAVLVFACLKAEAAIEALDSALDSLDEAVSSIEEAIE